MSDDRDAHALAARRRSLAEGLTLQGPETDLEQAVRSAEVVHLHGLWQAQTRRGARTARGGARPLPDRRPRDGRTLGLAAQALEEADLPGAGRGQEPPPGLVPARPVSSRNQPLAEHRPLDADLLRPQRRRSRVSSTTCPPDRCSKPSIPSSRGSSSCSSSGESTSRRASTCWPTPWAGSQPTVRSFTSLVAGNDDGAWPPFRDRMAQLGLTSRMTYLGHVSGERARQVWAAADAFILPSYSEGFSMAVLEALACRLPSLITTACHFPEVAAAGGAIVVTPDVDAVTQGLRDLLDRTHRRARPARSKRPAARRGPLHLGPAGGAPRRRLRVADRRRTAPRSRRHLTAVRSGSLSTIASLREDDHATSRSTTARRRPRENRRGSPDRAKTPVSVIVPVKNEAENLRRCLPALAWADEVFVVDSQSSDQTAEVAAALGATVVQFHFNGTLPQEKELGPREPAVPQRMGLDRRRRRSGRPRAGRRDRPPDRPRRGRWILPELPLLLPGPPDPPLRLFVVLEPAVVQASPGPLRKDARPYRRAAPATMRLTNTSSSTDASSGSTTSWNTTRIPPSPSGSRNTTDTRSGRPRSPNDSSRSRSPKRSASVQRFKRRLKKIAWRLPMRPLVRFVYAYFLRLGFLDGKPGLIFCGLLAFYDFLASANRYEQQIAAAGSRSEPEADADGAPQQAARKLAGSARPL